MCAGGNVTIPVAADGTLRTQHHGVTVVVIDAQRWVLNPRVKYPADTFRFLPAMVARHNSPGVDIMFHTIHYLDYLRETTGRICPTDGDLLVSVCNIPGLNNAFWTGGGAQGHMIYGNGDGKNMRELVGADVVAHELEHAHTETTAAKGRGLVYKSMSGAINEALSDCVAAGYEHYLDAKLNHDADPTNDIFATPDWTVGEDVVISGRRKLRDMANPHSCEQPMVYLTDRFWADPNDLAKDDGGVHKNSGVINHFFYRLCVSAGELRGPTRLLFRVSAVLDPNATFEDFAREARAETTVRLAPLVNQALAFVGL